MEAEKTTVVNALPLLSPLTGVGRYTFEVCRRLDNDPAFRAYYYYGYLSQRLRDAEADAHDETAAAYLAFLKKVLSRNDTFRRLGRQCLMCANYLMRRRFDLYWEPNHIPLPGIKSRRQATTIHDLSTVFHPQWHPVERIHYFRKHMRHNIRRSDVIITVSEAVKAEMQGIGFLRDMPVRVIPNGIDHNLFQPCSEEEKQKFRQKYGLPRAFILGVGSEADPRKNLDRLRKAHSHFQKTRKTAVPLVLAGGPCRRGPSAKAVITERPDEAHSLIRLGYLPQHELKLAYNAASLLVYPSLYEGFGIPPVEAMACGTPVITSDIPALRETCSDAAYFVDPTDADAIRAAIAQVLTDDSCAEALSRRGLARSRLYSWEQSAAAHRDLFYELLGDTTP